MTDQKTDQKVTLHVGSSSGNGEDHREIDLTETVQMDGKTAKVELLKALYGYSDGYDISGDVLLSEFSYHENANDARKEAGKFYGFINKGKAKEAKIAQAQAEVDKIESQMEVAMAEQDMISMIALSDERSKALLELEKTKKGKTSNGDRSNPLPPIAESNAFIRKSNGQSVLVLRGDSIPDYEGMKISEYWQAFQIASNGEQKGFWVWQGELGECTSNSDLNAKINRQILDLPGSSIGVNGLTVVNPENLETIRTTQLRGLP